PRQRAQEIPTVPTTRLSGFSTLLCVSSSESRRHRRPIDERVYCGYCCSHTSAGELIAILATSTTTTGTFEALTWVSGCRVASTCTGIPGPGGGGRIRTYVGYASRFTVCPR